MNKPRVTPKPNPTTITNRVDKDEKEEPDAPIGTCLSHIQSITCSSKSAGETVVVNDNKLYILDSTTLKLKNAGPASLSQYFNDNQLQSVDATYTLPNGYTVYMQGKRFVNII